MPGLTSYLNSISWKEEQDDLDKPETMRLWLPSEIPTALRENVCSSALTKIEEELRVGQLSESLASIRHHLRQRGYAGQLKNRNGKGQVYFLRSNAFISQVERHIRKHQSTYNNARRSLMNIRGPGGWEKIYQVLLPTDICGINERLVRQEEEAEYKRAREMLGLTDDAEIDEDQPAVTSPIDVRAIGEGKRRLSWIWYSVSAEEKNGSFSVEVEKSNRLFWLETAL